MNSCSMEHLVHVCVCVCYRPPVREVCPNHEVVMFQPRTVTTPKPRLFLLLLYSLLMNLTRPLLMPSDFLPGRNTTPTPPPHPPTSTLSPHGIICPPERHPYLSQYTENISPPPHSSLSESDSSLLPFPSPRLLDYGLRHSLAAI